MEKIKKYLYTKAIDHPACYRMIRLMEKGPPEYEEQLIINLIEWFIKENEALKKQLIETLRCSTKPIPFGKPDDNL